MKARNEMNDENKSKKETQAEKFISDFNLLKLGGDWNIDTITFDDGTQVRPADWIGVDKEDTDND